MPRYQVGFPGSAARSSLSFNVTRASDLPDVDAATWKKVAAFGKSVLTSARAQTSRTAVANRRLKDELVKRKLVIKDICGCGKALKSHLSTKECPGV